MDENEERKFTDSDWREKSKDCSRTSGMVFVLLSSEFLVKDAEIYYSIILRSQISSSHVQQAESILILPKCRCAAVPEGYLHAV